MLECWVVNKKDKKQTVSLCNGERSFERCRPRICLYGLKPYIYVGLQRGWEWWSISSS